MRKQNAVRVFYVLIVAASYLSVLAGCKDSNLLLGRLKVKLLDLL
jgi:hypothetical protein